jgi:hypothetical protein
MELISIQGSYKLRAVLVEPSQRKPWLVEEYTNVGFESEGRANHYIASTNEVVGMFATDIVKAAQVAH